MSARNIYHDVVIAALVADGWQITHNPYRLSYGARPMYIDLGAEKGAIGAEKGQRRIAVEVQSFLGPSPVRDLQAALGQYELYRMILRIQDPARVLFMAVHDEVHQDVFEEKLGKLIVTEASIKMIVFDPEAERITKWID